MKKNNINLIKSDLILTVKQIAKLFALQWKTIITSPVLCFIIFIFPIIFTAGIGTLIPAGAMFASSFSLVILLVVGIVYGDMKYLMNETTFKSNSRLIVLNQFQTTFSMTMTTFLVSFISFSIGIIFIVVCESNGFIFMSSFVFQDEFSKSSHNVIWSNISWSACYWYYFVTFLLMFSTFYFADNFFNSYKTFSMFVLVWMIVCLLFGGVMSSIWTIYDNKTNQFISIYRLSQKYDTASHDKAFDLTKPPIEFKNWLSWTPIIVPQWFTNQHFFYVFEVGASGGEVFTNGLGNNIPSDANLFQWSDNDNLWNFSLLSPFIYATLFTIFSLIINRKN